MKSMYSDMAAPVYEWLSSGNAWSPAWEYYVTGDIPYFAIALLYSDDIYNCYADKR